MGPRILPTPSLDLRDESAKKCCKCGVRNVPGSTSQDVCAHKMSNLAYFYAADGNAKGDITWKCCNCVRDFPRGGIFNRQPTMGLAEYEKMACVQCKSRPPELCVQMRQEHFNNPPPSNDELLDTANDKYR